MEGDPQITKNGTPFKGDLIDSEVSAYHRGSGKLTELESFPDKVIRVESFEELDERFKYHVEILGLVQEAKKLYEELGTRYGIIAPVDFLIGKNKNGEKVVYSIVDKIEPANNFDTTEGVKTAVEQTEVLYTALSKYFFDKFMEDGSYLCDISSFSQYVYGKKQGESEDKMYLVDTDIFLSNSRVGIYYVMYWLTRHMFDVETAFRTKFNEARGYMQKLLEEPFPEGITDTQKEKVIKNIEGIKEFLSNKNIDTVPASEITSFD